MEVKKLQLPLLISSSATRRDRTHAQPAPRHRPRRLNLAMARARNAYEHYLFASADPRRARQTRHAAECEMRLALRGLRFCIPMHGDAREKSRTGRVIPKTMERYNAGKLRRDPETSNLTDSASCRLREFSALEKDDRACEIVWSVIFYERELSACCTSSR
ncbi:hypothetical protein EVAR_49953_1 [Eumeta japonica]|uniref:Uncharacterized protein n=1 Tax=Eumeta variegata TaxID=151549 RepID=A0A4C1XTX2_EUMVA|nr:hypothetical protein EVAR_49953_1 [Eumeta japonica]